MAKIVLSKNDEIIREMALEKRRITIGRAPNNDIMIDDCAISAQHAVIVTVNGESFLEDLNSTNGTEINGQPVRKHFMQDGNVIELGRYRLVYHGSSSKSNEPAKAAAVTKNELAIVSRVRILKGSNSGREFLLGKSITTLGKASIQVVAIVRRTDGHHLALIKGKLPLINGREMKRPNQPVGQHDIIDLVDMSVEVL